MVFYMTEDEHRQANTFSLGCAIYANRLIQSVNELTVCDASQGLVEGGRVTVISESDTHSSREKPSGQSEGLLVL